MSGVCLSCRYVRCLSCRYVRCLSCFFLHVCARAQFLLMVCMQDDDRGVCVCVCVCLLEQMVCPLFLLRACECVCAKGVFHIT